MEKSFDTSAERIWMGEHFMQVQRSRKCRILRKSQDSLQLVYVGTCGGLQYDQHTFYKGIEVNILGLADHIQL